MHVGKLVASLVIITHKIYNFISMLITCISLFPLIQIRIQDFHHITRMEALHSYEIQTHTKQ
jgi:hypothetical protein